LNPKIRILLVVRWPVGGIRTFIKYVYGKFEAENYELTILGPEGRDMSVLIKDLKDVDVKFISLSKRPSLFQMFSKVMTSILAGNFDLVHSHGFTSGMSAALPAFLFGKPHILTSHDILNDRQFDGFAGRVKRSALQISLRCVTHVHSVSNDAQENLLRHFPEFRKGCKCIVIKNGIEIENFLNAKRLDLHELLKVDKDTFLIGFLGRFMAQKGFTFLVDAIELLSVRRDLSRKPIVVAFGDGDFIREEKSRLADRGLSGHFVFMPFTPDVAGVLKGLDVVVMPSRWEACPLLPMEALVSGTPLIASTCIGLGEVIENTPAIKVRPESGSDIAESLFSFMKSGSKGRFDSFVTEAADRFCVTNQIQSLKKLIKDTVDKSLLKR